jgi:hypothetical protein
MPTLNLNRFRQSNGARNIVIGDREYTGRPFSVMQFISYAEKFEAGGLSEAEELRMNVDAIVARLNDQDGNPIDRGLVEDMSAEELRMVVDFLSTAKARAKLPDAIRDAVNETWDRMGPYLDRNFDEDPSPTTTERSTSDFASTGSSESTEPLASPTAQ